MGIRGLFEGWHLVVLLVVVVIVFGWKRLPDAARSLGRSARILKSELGDMQDEGKSKASSQTVPGQTAPPAGSVPGESYAQPGQQAPYAPPAQPAQSTQQPQPGQEGYQPQAPQQPEYQQPEYQQPGSQRPQDGQGV